MFTLENEPSPNPHRAHTPPVPAVSQLRQAASLVCTIVQLLLLSKAVVVAVSAPDDVWPTAAEPDQPLFVGLANM